MKNNKVETIKNGTKCGCSCDTHGKMDLESLYWRGVSEKDREAECKCDKWENIKEDKCLIK